MANRRFTQFFQTLEKSPVLLSCNFIVDKANGNGLGQRSLKGPGILNVFMNTSATPAPGNPNPPAGFIIVQLQDCYKRYLAGFSGFVSQLSGTPLTAVVAGNAYVIVSLGTATTAQWNAVGLPVGIVPNVGASFIATASATIGGSAAVETPSVTGITSIEVVGDANQTIQSSAGPQGAILGSQSTAYMMFQCLADTSASVTTKIPTAPPNGAVVGMSFYMSNSMITVQGE